MEGGERVVMYGVTAAIILGMLLHAAGTAGIMSVGFAGLNSVFGTLSGQGNPQGSTGTVSFGGAKVQIGS